MLKVKLKQFLAIQLDDGKKYGIATNIMIWSPVHHWWIRVDDWSWQHCSDKELKFLLKQPIERIGLRSDQPGYIAVYLKDYGPEKNKQLQAKIGAK